MNERFFSISQSKYNFNLIDEASTICLSKRKRFINDQNFRHKQEKNRLLFIEVVVDLCNMQNEKITWIMWCAYSFELVSKSA